MPPPVEHKQTRIVLTIESGQVINSQPVRENEFIASVDCFVQMLEKAGFIVAQPHPAFNQNES